MDSYDVLVIGGGPAGVTAALRARELGATVALVERGSMGGTCTNDGCVPTRVLARAARLMVNTTRYADYGMTLSPPELDFRRLLDLTQRIVYQMHEKKQLLSHLDNAGAQVYAESGTAHFVDAHSIALANGPRLQAGKIILCAGGRARRVDFPGEDLAMTHSDVWKLQRLPKSLVVVGAAATGCQLASVFEAFGSRVTILEIAPRALMAEDVEVSQAIEGSFRRRGMQIITGISGVSRIERVGSELTLWYAAEGREQAVQAEAVVLSTGWLGNLAPLQLEAAGVETNGRYVVVDDHLRTSVPHIFAAGDITGRMMLVQSASAQARLAAENAVLGEEQAYNPQIVPHGGFTEPEYASVGPTEAQARAREACVVAVVPYAAMDRAVIDGRTEGFCKLIVSRESHRILGASVVGEQAMEVVHVAAAGIAAGMHVEQLAALEIAYPTFTAILGLAARRIAAEMGVMTLSTEWRSISPLHASEWEWRDS